MKRISRSLAGVGVVGTLSLTLGMGAAYAANSGTFPALSHDNNYLSNVHYNFYAPRGSCNDGCVGYDDNIYGTFVVNDPTTHLSIRNDGYGYKQIVYRSSKAQVPFNWDLQNFDVVVSDTISAQICQNYSVIPDTCASKTVSR